MSASCYDYNPSSVSGTSSKNYNYFFKIIISDEKMRSMSSEQLEAITKNVVTIENQFQTRLISTGRMRNSDTVNRMSLIAAELISNEEISQSIYDLMQAGVGIDFSCNEMLRDNFKEQSNRSLSKVYANVYIFTGDNSIKSSQWEWNVVPVSAERNYRNAGDSMDGDDNDENEISIQGEFQDEALIQDYYSGVFDELTSRVDVTTEETEDGIVKLILDNGVEMEFEADGNEEGRGFKKKWKKIKKKIKKNTPRVVGALVFATGGALGYLANSIPVIGQGLAYMGAACLMYSGTEMMKENEYYIGCKFEEKME
jgi:hypothetical protein